MAVRILSSLVVLYASVAWAAPVLHASDDAGTIYLGPLVDRDWGRPVAAGDLDGDGYDEVLVASAETSGGVRSNVHVMRGGPDAAQRGVIDLTSNGIDLTIVSANVNDNLGVSIAAGDVNGDGYDDLLICASFADFGGLSENGIAYLFYGGPNFFAASTRDLAVAGTWDVRFTGPVNAGDMGGAGSFGGFETHAADIGNLNGDGFGDIALGVHLAENGSLGDAGSVYVVAGRAFASGTTVQLSNAANALFRVYGNGEYDELGDVVYIADITGNGIEDLILGNHYYSQASLAAEGAVLVLRGRTTWSAVFNLTSVPADITILGDYDYDELGQALALGDFNGDGIVDLAASAPGAEDVNSQYGDGFVYGFLGSTAYQTGTHVIDVATATPAFLIKGEFRQNLGDELSAGDFNGDGLDDVAAAQRFGGGGSSSRGTIDIVFGRAFTPNQTFFAGVDTDVRIVGNPQDRIGFALSASDVDNNGIDEVLFGTPFNNGPSFSEMSGTAYVFDLTAGGCGVCGDLDGDNDVDIDDYQRFRSTMGRTASDPAFLECADFDGSGAIGLLDYQSWLFCYRAAQPPVVAVPQRVDSIVRGQAVTGAVLGAAER